MKKEMDTRDKVPCKTEYKLTSVRNHQSSIVALAIIGILVFGCTNQKVTYERVDVTTNIEYFPNTEFGVFEDLKDSRFEHLKEKYQLDTVFRGEKGEFKRILLLRHWIKSVIKIEDHNPSYPGGGFAESILDNALKGSGFHCSHFMRVQNAVMNAYGYVTRAVNAGPGAKGGPDGNHGLDEIWSNEHGKWFLSDAKYDHHFEKNGIPLSVLEVRDEFIKNRGGDMVLVKGPNRTPTDFDDEIGRTKEEFAQTYTWVQFFVNGNRHSIYPNEYKSEMIVLQDDYYNNNVYYRDGKPVAQKKLNWFIKVKDRKKIEWTPNVLDVETEILDDNLKFNIVSSTPNLAEYQIKDGVDGLWQSVDSQSSLKLTEEKHIWLFRSMNIAGVTGPEYKLVVQKKQP